MPRRSARTRGSSERASAPSSASGGDDPKTTATSSSTGTSARAGGVEKKSRDDGGGESGASSPSPAPATLARGEGEGGGSSNDAAGSNDNRSEDDGATAASTTLTPSLERSKLTHSGGGGGNDGGESVDDDAVMGEAGGDDDDSNGDGSGGVEIASGGQQRKPPAAANDGGGGDSSAMDVDCDAKAVCETGGLTAEQGGDVDGGNNVARSDDDAGSGGSAPPQGAAGTSEAIPAPPVAANAEEGGGKSNTAGGGAPVEVKKDAAGEKQQQQQQQQLKMAKIIAVDSRKKSDAKSTTGEDGVVAAETGGDGGTAATTPASVTSSPAVVAVRQSENDGKGSEGEGPGGKKASATASPVPPPPSSATATTTANAVAASPEDDGRAAAPAPPPAASPSFSMTLAIGPEDTRRVLRASRAFNAEVGRMRGKAGSDAAVVVAAGRVEGAGTAATGGGRDAGGDGEGVSKSPQGGGAQPPSRETSQSSATKRKSMDDDGGGDGNGATDNAASASITVEGKSEGTSKSTKKKVPEIVHSPPSREEPQTAAIQPPRSASSSTTDAPPAASPTGRPRPLSELLLPAAKACMDDPLLSSFLRRLESQDRGIDEVRTCLLFFLDADKSTKLLAAFEALSGDGGVAGEGGDKEEDASAKLVKREGLITLFQSFLLSISTCVHGGDGDGDGGDGGKADAPAGATDGGEGANTGGDWKGSEKTLKEILEVATFAADSLMEFARKEREKNGEESEEARGETDANGGGGASFDMFGSWYNSGGFSLVPWLELLDLSKWDYAGNGAPANGSASASAASSSSSKRARISNEQAAPMTPAVGNMNEPIGSPTSLFASGALLGATPQSLGKSAEGPAVASSARRTGGDRSFSAIFGEMAESRTVVSFDFTGSGNSNKANNRGGEGSSSFHIDITEENLVMLRNLVSRTGIAQLSPQAVEALMMKHARVDRTRKPHGETTYVISREQFGKFIREVVPKSSSKNFDPTEIENFSNYFTNFFTCFDYSWSDLKKDEVNAKELMVGFSFLFAGNKSTKLAAAYEMLDADRRGYLTQRGLLSYLRSYLTMLAGISLLSANKQTTTQIRKRLMSPNQRDDAFLAVENGAKWTLSHFLRAFEREHPGSHMRSSTRSNAVTFEDFAKWYTEGGYLVAPWLELLDLQKFLSLIGDEAGKYQLEQQKLGEVLFTFPLAKDRSLVILRDDAHYVKSVVTELGLLSLTSEDIWSVLFNDIAKSLQHAAETAAGGGGNVRKSMGMKVDQTTFVDCMMRILSGTGKLQQNSSEWSEFSPEETLKNFYLSFDLDQSKRVALNQLMCGLTLLCGGKKSNKLVFAFGLFGDNDDDSESESKKKSMVQDDFLYFFRSFLIVIFSCCNQSLSLSAEAVTQYISDTASEIAGDVMKYWEARNREKVNFEQFSEWYNEGGYETAPWLELLDLHKWVLAEADQQQHQQTQQQTHPQHQTLQPPMTPAPSNPSASSHTPGLTPGHEAIKALLATPKIQANGDCPPAPPDDDPLFDLDMSAVDEEVGDMDFMLQSESHGHVEDVNYADLAPTGVPPATTPQVAPATVDETQSVLKFNLLTKDHSGGYMVSIGSDQVQLLRRIVTETGLCQIDAPTVCKFILYDNKSRKQVNLTKKAFHAGMKRVFDHAYQNLPAPVSKSTKEELSKFTDKLFTSFSQQPSSMKAGKINAVELACGFTALCAGRKSDKLEHIFELLDENGDSLVSRTDISRFIQSFLVILLNVSSSFTHLYGGMCSNDAAAKSRAIAAGTDWATTTVFEGVQKKPATKKNGGETDNICFDDFADWYTRGGFQHMPWLELLDLRKWVLGDSK